MTRNILEVPAISCEHCEHTVKTVLGELPGIEEVVVDIPAKIVTVTYDGSTVDLDQMKSALAEEEYPVASVR